MILLVGDKSRFAIEATPESFVDGWVLGRFRFWLCGKTVGDWDDTTDLKGCVNWLREFSETAIDRFEPALNRLGPEAAFERLHASAYASEPDPRRQPIPFAYARLNISHLGMSSFDNYEIYLLTNATRQERCLWRVSGDTSVQECILGPKEMETVAAEFVERFAATWP